MIISVNYELRGSSLYHGCGVDELTWSYTTRTKQRYSPGTLSNLYNDIDSLLSCYEHRLGCSGLAIIDLKKCALKLISDKKITVIKIEQLIIF